MLERLSEMPEVFVSIITGELMLLSKNPNYAWVFQGRKTFAKFCIFSRKSNLPKEAKTMRNLEKKIATFVFFSETD